eukprot:Selendium_serpulae@DN4520_c0_g1_i3.p1
MLRVSVDSLVVCDTDGDEDLTNFLRKRAAEKTKPIYSHIDKGDASDTANATDDDAGKDDDELWDNAPRKGDTVGVVLSTGQLVTAKLVITSTGGAPHCLRNSVMQRTSNCDETTSRGDQLLRPIDTSEKDGDKFDEEVLHVCALTRRPVLPEGLRAAGVPPHVICQLQKQLSSEDEIRNRRYGPASVLQVDSNTQCCRPGQHLVYVVARSRATSTNGEHEGSKFKPLVALLFKLLDSASKSNTKESSIDAGTEMPLLMMLTYSRLVSSRASDGSRILSRAICASDSAAVAVSTRRGVMGDWQADGPNNSAVESWMARVDRKRDAERARVEAKAKKFGGAEEGDVGSGGVAPSPAPAERDESPQSEESEEVPPSRLRVDWGWKGCLVFPDDCREGLLGVMEAEPLLSNLMSKMALGYSDSRILRWAEQQRVTTAVQPAMYHYGLRLADMGDIACDLIAMPSYVRKEEKEAQEAATRNRYDRLEELATAGDEKGPLDT